MTRPWLLRALPARLRSIVYYRHFRARRAAWPGLYRDAPLWGSPSVRMDLRATDESHSAIAFTGIYELRLTRRMLAHARHPGGVLVDVGANYGYYSLQWCGARTENRAIAFEASPKNQDPLAHNARRNGFEGRMEVRREAAGRAPGTLPFLLSSPDDTGSGGFGADSEGPTVAVPVVALDDALPETLRVEVLKVDAEGADAWVLEGAERMLAARRVRHVYFEENGARMHALGIPPGSARARLERHGYEVRPLGPVHPDFGEFEAHAPGK